MKYFEMFAGVAGFGIGIQRAYESNRPKTPKGKQESDTGIRGGNVHAGGEYVETAPTCVGFSEIDPHASNVLRYHYPNVKNYGDCTKIQWSEVPDFDLLVGGSPCQDFSIAGKRAGLVGARSGLAYEYVRALEEKHPAHFIWENVRGVLSSNRGWDFGAILNQMAEAGYSLQWQVLNAKHFGVPQNRERVFVIGTRSDLGSPREVFFEPITAGKDILNLEPGAPQANRRYDTTGISPTMPTSGGGRHTPMISHQQDAVQLPEGVSKTLAVGDHGASSHLTRTLIDGRIRRLTPTECERLMSWPDGHTAKGVKPDGTKYEMSDTQRYKMCGNGVVSEVVATIIQEMY